MLAHLAAAVVLAANPVTPPPDLPDLPEEPVVFGNVTVAWTAGEFPQIQVGWDEPEAMRNRVEILRADGTLYRTGPTLGLTDANRAGFHPGDIETAGTYRVAVRVIDAAGTPVGEPALSAVFDNDRLPAATIDAVEPGADGTVLVRWTTRAPGPDSTPGDPLDLPVDPRRVVPAAGSQGRPLDALSEPLTSTSFVVPATIAAPYRLAVQTVNEWGETDTVAKVRGTSLTATVSARATTGARLQVTGVVRGSVLACTTAGCFPEEYPDAGRAVQLEARTGTAAAWQVVATARSAADGTYRLSVVSPGSRQYRVVAPPTSCCAEQEARMSGASAPVTTTSVPPATGGTAGDGGDGRADGGGGGGLPITGAPAGATAATGALLVTLGVLLCAVGRRPRRTR